MGIILVYVIWQNVVRLSVVVLNVVAPLENRIQQKLKENKLLKCSVACTIKILLLSIDNNHK
jgi:hypothetical protein